MLACKVGVRSAGTTYYSTEIKGNYTFKIDKGSGVSKDEEEKPSMIGRAKRAGSDLAAAAKNIVNPVNKPRETGTRSKRK